MKTAETTFSCRCCGNYVTGSSLSGGTTEPGWRFLERLDGPNHICPVCVNDPLSLDSLREDGYEYVSVGELCPVVAGEQSQNPGNVVVYVHMPEGRGGWFSFRPQDHLTLLVPSPK